MNFQWDISPLELKLIRKYSELVLLIIVQTLFKKKQKKTEFTNYMTGCEQRAPPAGDQRGSNSLNLCLLYILV